jgi:hypothetical protein
MTKPAKDRNASTNSTLFSATSHIGSYGAFPRFTNEKDASFNGQGVTIKISKFN